RGISTSLVRLSGNAHLVMPWHQAIDRGSERRLGRLKIGTTRRGIGPTYADKAYRLGIRVQDLLDEKILRQKIEVALAEKNVWLERVYGATPIELEGLVERYEKHAERLRPMIADTSLLLDPPRDRADVRRQGLPVGNPRSGPARREDPAPEDRGRARGEERLARARLRCHADRARGPRRALREARRAAAADDRRHVAARRP